MGHKNLLSTVHEYPIRITHGSGNLLYDDTGKSYLDFWGDEGVNSLGYNHPEIKEAIKRNTVNHIPKMYSCPVRENLAERLVEFSGIENGQVIFSNSGTEANEAAIKLSRMFWYKLNKPYKYDIATLEGNFHGRTGFSLAASDSSDSPHHKLGFGPMPQGFYTFKTTDELVRLSKSAGGLSGAMMSTILGNNKIVVYLDKFLEKIKKASVEYNFHLILDEVQVSMGRTGKRMGYHNYDGFNPDIVSIGKGIAAGMPLSATIVTKEIADEFEPGMHFNTFGGNVISASVALVVLDYVENNLNLIAKKGELMKGLLDRLSFTKYVVGKGLHLAFKISDAVPYDGYQFCTEARKLGLLIVTHRKNGEIRFTPPLTISKVQIKSAVSILNQAHINLMTIGTRG